MTSLPFTVVRKGYDRDEVRGYFERFDGAFNAVLTDRNAANSRADELEQRLTQAQLRIAQLESEVARLSALPGPGWNPGAS